MRARWWLLFAVGLVLACWCVWLIPLPAELAGAVAREPSPWLRVVPLP